MKFILVAVFVFFFVAMPMYLLNTLVMPGLQSMQHVYGNADSMADATVRQTAAPQQ